MPLSYFTDYHPPSEESDKCNGNLIDNPRNDDSVNESAYYIAEEMPAKVYAAITDCNCKQEAEERVPLPFEEQGGYHCKPRYVGGVV